MRLQALLAAFALCSTTGCLYSMAVDPMGNRNAFDQAQRRYTQLLRWGEPEMATEFVDPELREEFRRHIPILTDIRITDFETGAVDYSGDSASVTVVYEAFGRRAPVQLSFREHQAWYREGMSGNWMVRPDLEELAGLFEPAP